MNKSELVDTIALEAQITKAAASRALDAALAAIQNSVANNEPVRLVGFGTFERSLRKERSGRNPKTNETMQIPANQFPKFKASAVFKAKVAGK